MGEHSYDIYSIINLPLYSSFKISGAIFDNFNNTHIIDMHCIECGYKTPFKRIIYGNEIRHHIPLEATGEYILDMEFMCLRDEGHKYNFLYKLVSNSLMKVGQFPSIADLELHKIQKYRSILKRDYKDFSKAIGLYSHGIGAGSYVYLRRIFENLINEQKEVAIQSDSSLSEIEFAEKRMDEKIQYIKNFLPETLVENRKIYSILSKGIHELSEDDCLSMFPSLELGIEIILDWKLVEKEKQEKENQLSKFVSEAIDKFK